MREYKSPLRWSISQTMRELQIIKKELGPLRPLRYILYPFVPLVTFSYLLFLSDGLRRTERGTYADPIEKYRKTE